MFDLPLFPLNTVLFPGMPLTLHIFEDRYKAMVRGCLKTSQPFGVVLIRRGHEALDLLVEPHLIGCTARIIEMQPLKEGRMNIVALGQRRFRILSLNYEKPYLVGKVELYPLEKTNQRSMVRSGHRLRPWVKCYMDLLTEISDASLDSEHIPNDPLVLGYLAAVLVQVPSEQKQELLTSQREIDFLTAISDVYRREVALLRAITSRGVREYVGDFSRN